MALIKYNINSLKLSLKANTYCKCLAAFALVDSSYDTTLELTTWMLRGGEHR